MLVDTSMAWKEIAQWLGQTPSTFSQLGALIAPQMIL